MHEARAARQLVHFAPPSDLLEGSHHLEVLGLDARAVGLAATLAVGLAATLAVERERGCRRSTLCARSGRGCLGISRRFTCRATRLKLRIRIEPRRRGPASGRDDRVVAALADSSMRVSGRVVLLTPKGIERHLGRGRRPQRQLILVLGPNDHV